ncbi:carboxymuconolactone decarboxylase family protein [Dyadobacter psychrophilus]|uniref:Alkylhydroperoxidase AhpD family core domain-containing protein n=1 Tax=Dyadobacter psychrophilus TaxID=651661 RepID=A0A1T5BXY7_9BACT|nr:carboxymuconolactone decarboxylase family protein [Dyadobacter psychrophilus]SKB51863.1 alkylhydroperoxidase AhpD family core domain-containing protein [Dyadobacter psychrophilus]
MENRLNMQAVQPEAYKAMFALEGFLKNSQLTKVHKELIKMRASQINGCAFCLDMHSKEALKTGETIERLILLNAWKETTLFTKEEKIILALTEAVTLIHHEGIPAELYRQAEETFGQQYLAQLIMAIVTINGWNRIAISTHMQPAG